MPFGISISFVKNFGKLGNAIMRAISYYEKYEIIVALGGNLTRTDRRYKDVPECYIIKDRDGIKKAGVTHWDWNWGGPKKKLKPGEPLTGTPGFDIITVTLNYWRSLELEWIPDPNDECCE